MTDRPIIFSAEMVRALLDGRKTQHREILKPQPDTLPNGFAGLRLPYAVGDRLWVRESFITGFDIDDEFGRPVGDRKVWYRATDRGLTWYDPDTESTLDNPPWKSSTQMPRWASRLTLIVTDVRVQRLQDISEADAVADGMQPYKFPGPWWQGYRDDGDGDLVQQQYVGETPPDWMIEPRRMKDMTHLDRSAVHLFTTLWNDLHGPDAWDRNDWVAALTFETHRQNIDQMEPTND